MTAPPDEDHTRILDEFAHEFVVALINQQLYHSGHEVVQDNLRKMLRHLREAIAAGFPSPLRIDLKDHQLQVDGHALVGSSLQAGKLWRLAGERRIGAIVFGDRTTAYELGQFVELLIRGDRNAFEPSSMRDAFARHGIENIRVILDHEPQSRVEIAGDAAGEAAVEGYQALADVLQESHVAAYRGDNLELDRARGVVQRAMVQMGSAPSELLALANYDDIDSFTVGHSVRVALLALQVAKACGASQEDLLLVGTAALMHDIGKSRIPQSILFKQSRLDEEEWATMMQHPRLGAEILLEQKNLHPSAIGAAFCHHMCPEGGGYPRPTLGFDPSGISKLVRVCDVFEALTAVRPYKKALTPLEAHVIMHRQPEDFDPHWLRFFLQVIGLYPLGTRLVLDSGERAIVERHGSVCDRPIVRLLSNAEGNPLETGAPRLVPIGDAVDGRTRHIAHVERRGREREGSDTANSRIVESQPPQHGCVPPLRPE